ncbi:hypothetical protein D3C87_64520 [compost metagenome]
MKQLLLFLICGTLVCSCTITKRHFGTGYHVEWNRKIKTGPERNETPKTGWTENNTALKSIHEPDSILIDEIVVADQAIPNAAIKPAKEREVQPVKQSESGTVIKKDREIKTTESYLEDEDEGEEAPKRRMHPLMWGIWGMWSIAIVCMFFVTFYAEFLIGVAIGFFIAMIFAIIVIRTLRKHPEKYRFKGLSYPFAILAIVFGGISILGLLIFLLGGVPVGPGG